MKYRLKNSEMEDRILIKFLILSNDATFLSFSIIWCNYFLAFVQETFGVLKDYLYMIDKMACSRPGLTTKRKSSQTAGTCPGQ